MNENKLDRHVNPDGSGKYGVINLRRLNSPECPKEFKQWYDGLLKAGFIITGRESPKDQFFIMKYGDKFTSEGLKGYANAAKEAGNLEYANSIYHEAELAEKASKE